ncbi:MAG: ABC transporter permease [candidate division Zixibacteria bacterium]|nr:ABC transporter permease [candidate division Zixibacteria bacterium]
MTFHFLSFACKALRKQKLYVAITMFGLSIALGASLLILSYANYEMGYERCHDKADRIYRIGGNRTQGDLINYMASIMFPLGRSLKETVPGVEEQVRVYNAGDVTIQVDNDREFNEPKFLLADPSVFSMFTIPLVRGDSLLALSRPYSVVISESVSKTLFAGTDPVGKTVAIHDSIMLMVTGIMEDLPTNTRIHTDCIASLATLESMGIDLNEWNDFGTFDAHTFVLLSEGVRPESVDAGLRDVLASHLGDESRNYHLHTQSLKELYFTSHLSDELGPSGSINDVYLFIGIGVLLLLMACFNYVNLSTARIFHRRRELLARSMAGANPTQLIAQFLGESVLLSSLSMVIGLVLYDLSIPYLEAYVGKSLEVGLLDNLFVWLAAPILVFIVGVIAGSYPAVLMVRQWPGGMFSRHLSTGSGKSRLRKVLVVVQAFIAIGLAGFTVGVERQMHFIDHFDYGFTPHNVWLFEFGDDATPGQKEIVKRECEALGVTGATLTVSAPGESVMWITTAYPAGQSEDELKVLNTFTGDDNFCSTFDFELVGGHWLSDDAVAGRNDITLINETAAEQLGLADPIGAELSTSRGPLTVVGIVKDFYPLSLHNPVFPCMITANSPYSRILAVHIPDGATSNIMPEMKRIWERVFPTTAFQGHLLTNIMGESYMKEKKFMSLCYISSVLAILIAVFGLLGLISFIMERRVREIGIRKCLGASLTSVVRLLTGEFILLVMVAGLLVWPLTDYSLSRWLDTYAYRTEFEWFTFMLVVASALLLTFLTIGFKILKTATTNPADVLRVE